MGPRKQDLTGRRLRDFPVIWMEVLRCQRCNPEWNRNTEATKKMFLITKYGNLELMSYMFDCTEGRFIGNLQSLEKISDKYLDN